MVGFIIQHHKVVNLAHDLPKVHHRVGGFGTYPVHRFFLWATALDLANGGAQAQLESLGGMLPERVGFEECVGG